MVKLIRSAHEADKQRLYKFRSLKDRDKIESIFAKQELHFSSPASLNDPFECKPWVRPPILTTEPDRRSARKAAYEMNRRHGMSRHEARRRAKEAGSAKFMEQRAKELTDGLADTSVEYRICSMAGDALELLLWSHYADSHRGISLCFDSSHDDEFGAALEVVYSDDLPSIGFFDRDPECALVAMALTKSSVWKYEQEFRIIVPNPPIHGILTLVNDNFTFPADRLIEVILGCQIKPDDEEFIRRLVVAYPTPIKIRRAVRSKTKFALTMTDA